MTTTQVNEAALKAKYDSFTTFELRQEFNRIRSIPNARTNIQALTQMTVLLAVMKEKNVTPPTNDVNSLGTNRSSTAQGNYSDYGSSENSGAGVGSLILGLVLVIGGIALSAGTNSIFYGYMNHHEII